MTFDLVLAEHLASNLVALDMQTAIAKSKLLRTLQEPQRRSSDAAAA